MTLATILSPDRVCLVCGNQADGHRLIEVHPADEPQLRFSLELPLCFDHHAEPEADLIDAFQASHRLHQAEAEAAAIRAGAAKLMNKPCIICDAKPYGVKLMTLDEHQARLIDAEAGDLAFVPLCRKCGDGTGPDAWTDAILFEQEVDRHATFKS